MPAKKAKLKPAQAKKTAPARATARKPAAAKTPAAAKAAHAKSPAAVKKPAKTAAKKVAPRASAHGVSAAELALLTGPRNVQPYIIHNGEEYMSQQQLEHFRRILLMWKRDLMEEVDRTVSHMQDEAANFPDPNDRATQEEEFSLELRTRDRERKLIRKIDEAIDRINDGSYGFCLETGEPIGIKRLEARPVATLSLEAQERRERREKQYGDRDDRYR